MISADSFWTSSLRSIPRGDAITRILAAAIAAVEPATTVRRAVLRQGNRLVIGGLSYDLPAYRRIFLLGLGKAAVPMSAALAELLGYDLADALVITKHFPLESPPALARFPILTGNHPIPGENSLEAGKRALEFLAALREDDLLFCLISGGGSALVTAPVEGIALAELQTMTSTLLACGARIDEINILRRRLDRFKGGGVVQQANGATIVSLILSDVVGNPLETIASGPTVPDPTQAADARKIIQKYRLKDRLPPPILRAAENTPPPLPADHPHFARVQNLIVGDNLMAAQAALRQAKTEGFHPYLLRVDLQGEARQVAFDLATILRQAWQTGDPAPRPACLLAGGETTVTLRGNGRGGRNTELALAAVTELADFPDAMLITLATDGEDGPTDAAGAVVTGETFRRALALGLDPQDHLQRNDSYTFFDALDDLLRPGPTGTNVNDLIFLFT
ncbi:MAG: glycerate kinase [Anaerolineales bacterium]|nr:glycerate kinase [Anaerolineales bacterium]MCX7608116.1 glycerate kinase [Anaerolineales bacterium]MDW8227919.1 glycerate kinase [Anaerolineales bacterium]